MPRDIFSNEKEIGFYGEPQECCPDCESTYISNEDAPEDGVLTVTCHDCSYQWAESEEK